MGLLNTLQVLRRKLTSGSDQKPEATTPEPAIDAPYSEHTNTEAEVPTLSSLDTAAAGFPPEIR